MKTLVVIIFCLCAMAKVQAQISKSTGVPMGSIMPGPSSVYGVVFTNDDVNSINLYSASVKQYDVYKDEKGTGNFKKILSLTFPTSFADFRSRVGEEVAQQVKNNFNANADEEAYKMLVAGDPNKMGFLVFSKIFLKGIGVLWQDVDVKGNQSLTTYKILKVDNAGREQLLLSQKLGDVSRVPFAKYELQNLTSTDSVVQISWYAKTANTPAFMAKVYRKSNTDKSFTVVPQLSIMNNMGDTSKISFSERVTPSKLYNYYVVPEDFAGNEGLPSDTAFAISKSFSQLKGIEDFKIADSLKGAWLTWKGLPNEGLYTGIQILKSRKTTDGFIEVATISSTDSSYYDKEILPNVVYFYQLRPLTIGAKGFGLLPSASANIAIKNQREIPFAPQGLKVWQDSTAQVKLYWDVNPEIDQFAYYVLRGTSKEDMRIISPALRTNVYTDSLSNLDGQTTYFYGIKLMNISQKMSDVSTTVMFKPLKVEFVPYPSGVSARYADGAVKLLWEDMIAKHDEVIGYKVYRKGKADKEFKLLNTALINTVVFEDATAEVGQTYEYGITAVNGSASQSILSPVAFVSIPTSSVLAPPADLYLVNKTEGVYLSWPNASDAKNLNVIYRKAAAEKDFKMIAEISTDNYVDASAQKGMLYSYRIVSKNKLGNSNPGVEKSIRRN